MVTKIRSGGSREVLGRKLTFFSVTLLLVFGLMASSSLVLAADGDGDSAFSLWDWLSDLFIGDGITGNAIGDPISAEITPLDDGILVEYDPDVDFVAAMDPSYYYVERMDYFDGIPLPMPVEIWDIMPWDTNQVFLNTGPLMDGEHMISIYGVTSDDGTSSLWEDYYFTVGESCVPTGLPDDNCDDIDDDCNGFIDDGFAPWPTVCGEGECAGNMGMAECIGGVIEDTCNPYDGEMPEACDGFDNDCDGLVDDDDPDYAPDQTMCGIGNCTAMGSIECIGGMEFNNCVPGPPMVEICGEPYDEDCDGVVDNGCEGCVPTGFPDNNCDYIDDDCNGFIDDGYVEDFSCFLPGVCGLTNMESSCHEGIEEVCMPGLRFENPEVSCDNGLDDDCDGLTDYDDWEDCVLNSPPTISILDAVYALSTITMETEVEDVNGDLLSGVITIVRESC